MRGESYERLKAFKEDILRRQESAKDKRIQELESALRKIADADYLDADTARDMAEKALGEK